MVEFPDIVLTPEVEDAVARSRSGGNRPIPVIIVPKQGSTPGDVANALRAAGMTGGLALDETEDYLFATLPPDVVEKVADQEVVKRIWLDHEVGLQAEKSLRTIQAEPFVTSADSTETCEDVTWAVLDDGIDATHPALKGCNVKDYDFTGEGAVGGHGTHIAGLIGGFAPDDDFYGVAPKCQISNYKVLGRAPTNARTVIKALESIRKLNREAGRLTIHGANLSLGYLSEESFKVFSPGHSPICEEVNRLVASGVFVAAAAGNFGAQAYLVGDQKYLPVFALVTIADPGTAELPVTVGSTHKEYPNRYGVSVFSSKGPTGDGRLKPDLLAPGEKIRSCVPGGQYLEQSGTSQATAHVSGIAAFLLHRFPDLVGQPQTVKEILLRSCQDLLRDRNFQGHGLVNLAAALQLARDRSGV